MTVPGAQGRLIDLSRGQARQRRYERDALRAFVTGNAGLAVGNQPLLGHARSIPDHDDGLDGLDPFGMGHPDYRGIQHIGVTCECLFDFTAVDVLAAGNDHVLLAIDEKQVAFLVQDTNVARVIPAVAQRFERRRSVVPVAIEHGLRAHDHLSGYTGRAWFALLVLEAEINFRRDVPHGPQAPDVSLATVRIDLPPLQD